MVIVLEITRQGEKTRICVNQQKLSWWQAQKYNDTVNKGSVNSFAYANQTLDGSTCIL